MAGFSVTGIDHVKNWVPEIKPIVLTHVGTNQFILGTYLPEKDCTEPEGFEYAKYRDDLNHLVPELFTGKCKIFTEFGQSLFLKAGFSVTRIVFIKDWVPDIKPIVLTHVGTNQFIGETYLPDVWRHRYLMADSQGNLKSPENHTTKMYDLASPMCFQGDYLAKDVELPTVEPGDRLIILNTGPYTMAMYSRFNSILPSPVYGFSNSNGQMRPFCIKKRES